jgi:hypothetical protein
VHGHVLLRIGGLWLCGAFGVSPVLRVQDSTQATQDWGVLDPCAQKMVQKPGTPFVEKLTL